ncbi:MAG: hypothetical protein ACNI26_06955 [Terasakiella sp.]|uniref:hypothetical protein n=1 Tax=unclassified Terasakiella TaxID=2614952 RepID=UPI003B00FD7A
MFKLNKKLLTAGLALVMGLSTQAFASSYVVISSSIKTFKAGDQITSETIVDIPDKKSVVFINAQGKTLHLKGPYKDKLEKDGAGGGDSKAMRALASLVKTTAEDSSSVGAIRAASLKGRDQALAINISETGDYCIIDSKQPIIDRYKKENYATVTLVNVADSMAETLKWKDAGEINQWPENLKITDGDRFLVMQEGKDSKTLINLHILENRTYSDVEFLVSLAAKECNDQARGLLAIIQREAINAN